LANNTCDIPASTHFLKVSIYSSTWNVNQELFTCLIMIPKLPFTPLNNNNYMSWAFIVKCFDTTTHTLIIQNINYMFRAFIVKCFYTTTHTLIINNINYMCRAFIVKCFDLVCAAFVIKLIKVSNKYISKKWKWKHLQCEKYIYVYIYTYIYMYIYIYIQEHFVTERLSCLSPFEGTSMLKCLIVQVDAWMHHRVLVTFWRKEDKLPLNTSLWKSRWKHPYVTHN